MRLHPVDVEVAHSAALELTILTVERLQLVVDLADVLPQINGSHEGLLTPVALVLLTGVVGHPVEILSYGVRLDLGFTKRILGARVVLNNLLEGIQQSEALVLLFLWFSFNVEFIVLNLDIFFFDVTAIELFHLLFFITLIRRLKFDVVFNFDVAEEISTELTEVPRILSVEEQKTVSTPGVIFIDQRSDA